MLPIPIDAEGRFAGYASIFGVPDDGGDIVMPGAFSRSLVERGRVRMLFQHDPKEPIGLWEELREDGFGLFARGRLLAGVPRADALRRLIETRALDGLSIGFRTVRATRDGRGGPRRLWQVELWEISIVTFPMMAGARIAAGAGQGAHQKAQRALSAALSVFANQ
ncbi:HK97 family phage prohead protease [Arsenicitalea aurantiaca]|uniref:HK97 family phage prohead protease n=1 Tax=Arsenicitalea aurantiaca TaxID=1783274 RepID=A0A433XA89_9HYPH|nr:HK97 family phage prohead protease [Arsenicitalea aurantiaca]RUT31001.1 HK97 family phage prohead protease [Arsenicitalea aurantiaca]